MLRASRVYFNIAARTNCLTSWRLRQKQHFDKVMDGIIVVTNALAVPVATDLCRAGGGES